MTQFEGQLALYPENSEAIDDWTFAKARTRGLTHCFHDYPARMIPQVAGRLIDMFGDGSKTLFDPYCGTGTSLVEGMVRGMKTIGTDLNPLARLIAEAKICPPEIKSAADEIRKFRKRISAYKETGETLKLPGIRDTEFWFKPAVTEKLSHIKKFTGSIKDRKIRLFFQTAFSETVRESSNTRSGEFKLYRYDAEALENFSPDVFGMMTSKLCRNLEGARQFSAKLKKLGGGQPGSVYGFDSCAAIPQDILPKGSAGIVVTSPPYGDSQTTVAYGQYCRLSAAWLGLEGAEKIDRKLMGGKKGREIKFFPCAPLNRAIGQIAKSDEKRALSVSSFYDDLQNSVTRVAEAVKTKGYACYVVGCRKVKGVQLPTDIAVKSFFENAGFAHIKTFARGIPNKRMPSKNSPTNIAAARGDTMTKEFIVAMRKK